MAVHSIKMPDVGEGITEAEIVEWTVAVGDLVREDDVLAAVMTDKATVEIPSPVDGKIRALQGDIGEMIAVGATIISIETADNGAAVEATGDVPDRPENIASAPVEEQKASTAPPSSPGTTEPAIKIDKAQAQSFAKGPPRAEGEKPIASPSVRRRAADAGIRLSFVRGSGPAGRIIHDDLDAYLRGAMEPVSSGPQPDTRVTETKVIGLRRKIAERMQDAKSRIPHITYVDEVDMSELEILRKQLNAQRKAEQPKLTLLPFIMMAVVRALKVHPKLSAHYDDAAGVVRQYGAAHIGIAVQTANGLMVAVIRHAEVRDIWGLADEAQRLADAARDGTITRDELTGSTITLSSLGSIGGIVSTPVINSPEVAIVGVNKMATRPVFVEGDFVPRKIMNLSSSFDHRIIDGWDAAEFIQHIRASLETPATLFMEP